MNTYEKVSALIKQFWLTDNERLQELITKDIYELLNERCDD